MIDELGLLEKLPVENVNAIRAAMLLTLGGYPVNTISAGGKKKLVTQGQQFFFDDDPGVHSAAEWCLRRLGEESWLDEKERQALSKKSWWINKQGHTMVRIAAGQEFSMGARPGELAYAAAEEPRFPAKIARPYAIATKEVTVGQIEMFIKELDAKRKQPLGKTFRELSDKDRGFDDQTRPKDAKQLREPASFVTFTVAAAYCNWLSMKEGIDPKQWCYPQPEIDKLLEDDWPAMGRMTALVEHDVMKAPVNLSKTGYRLPTEIEWEFASRAGSESKYYFGDNPLLLGKYALYRGNAPGGKLAPVGSRLPNDLGLFDTLGNVAEWCQDWRTGAAITPNPRQTDAVKAGPVLTEDALDYESAVRGGSFNDRAIIVRAAYRIARSTTTAHHDIGFRIACTLAN